MAKGTKSKEIITQKILDTFDGSFKYDKEIRIPIMEDGELIQLKCTLTCAKTNVEQNNSISAFDSNSNEINFDQEEKVQQIAEITDEEKNNIARLAKMLNL